MRFDVSVTGWAEFAPAEIRAGERAVSLTMRGVSQTLKGAWRDQVRMAGLGSKLANAIRSDAYPKGKDSLSAAAMVWSKAAKIVSAFEEGAVINSQNGFWLAIPLPAAGRGAKGRITPGEWEKRRGRRLRFVYRSGRSALLVDDGTVLARAGKTGRDGKWRAARGFRNKTIPIFALVPQVRLKKRLNLYAEAERQAAMVPARIVANWR